MTPRPPISSSQGAKLPTAASSLPGRPKIAAPIIPFRARNAAPQMPTSRRVDVCSLAGSDMRDSLGGANQGVDRIVDMLGMAAERQDRTANVIFAVDPGSAE